MKLLLVIILLAVFSASDAYGFINKGKSTSAGKQKKGLRSLKSNNAGKLSVTSRNKLPPTQALTTVTKITKPPYIDKTLAPKVKSTVEKLQQRYQGNRELLIKHLQKQIALKKKQQIEQHSNPNLLSKADENTGSQTQQDVTNQQLNQTENSDNKNAPQNDQLVLLDNSHPEALLQQSIQEKIHQTEVVNPVNKKVFENKPNQVREQPVQIEQTLHNIQKRTRSPKGETQQNVPVQKNIDTTTTNEQSTQHSSLNNPLEIQLSHQNQQNQEQITQQQQNQQLTQKQQDQQFTQQQQNQQQQNQGQQNQPHRNQGQQKQTLQNNRQQTQTQQNQRQLIESQEGNGNQMQQQLNQQQFIPQAQIQQQPISRQNMQQQQNQHQIQASGNNNHIAQQQPQNNFGQQMSHVEQSFMPQQDLLQIQNQFQNRNAGHSQRQMQSMDMLQPLNFIQQQQNAAYQTRDQMQNQRSIQDTHVQIQQMPQQQNSHMISQMHSAVNQMLPRQHILMPLNSLSMDPMFQSKMMLPERIVFLNNAGGSNNVPVPTTSTPPMPTTTMTTTTTTTPVTTTSTREPGKTVKMDTGSLQYQFMEKEMKKQDLEIMKLELEIRALKRAETMVPNEIELEARKKTTTSPTTTTVHPFLAFGHKKFPFDF